ncbi:hypothetical protein [Azospirillum brasilense]|uniref:Uncharacterized protein n=1 Tax=Azospirillum brasilense TaxID=192 RepID=A0A6L3AZ46_AZOBR|nr:hypothetical protein [Azospirillum brasilense]KAA0684709.1 hypothetical protein DS837_16885 [Azospirillum brasilense]
MMINFLIILGIIAIGAWLGNVLLAVDSQVAQSRSRMRAAKDTIGKLEATIRRLQHEEEHIVKEIEECMADTVEARRKQSDIQRRLSEAQTKQRPQLLILTDRRNPNDREWLVTVVNTQIGEIDALHPLAVEWARGRDYLVWAESDREAGERAIRRFSARPGYQIKQIKPLTKDIYTTATDRTAA